MKSVWPGVLRLTLDRDTHEQLGLTGSESHFKPRASRYNVSVDLRAPSFAPGKKLHERVLWCLSKRVSPAELFVYWINGTRCWLSVSVALFANSVCARLLACVEEGKCGSIKFPEGVQSKQLECELSAHEFKGIDLPHAEVPH